MSDIEKILAIVGIIWLAHIPFIVPFVIAARQPASPAPTPSEPPARDAAPEAEKAGKLVASA